MNIQNVCTSSLAAARITELILEPKAAASKGDSSMKRDGGLPPPPPPPPKPGIQAQPAPPPRRGIPEPKAVVSTAASASYVIVKVEPANSGSGMEVPHDFQSAVLKLLNCPSCNHMAYTPIFTCKEGHIICSPCGRKVKRCKICKSKFTKNRNAYLESMAALLKVKCSHALCEAMLQTDQIDLHKQVCPFRPVLCNEFQSRRCQGTLVNLEDYEAHLVQDHEVKYGEVKAGEWHTSCYPFNTLKLKDQKFSTSLMGFDGHLFSLKARKNGTELFMTVSLLGSEESAMKYRAVIRLQKPFDASSSLEWSGRVHSIHETFDSILEQGDALGISPTSLLPFCNRDVKVLDKTWDFGLTVLVQLQCINK